MPKFRYLTADVFTDVPFGGNQLAIFPDARGIPEHRLLDVTREFNFSETTFVYPPADPSHTRRVRIFTPGEEIPFAGHPTVGTAHVLAAIGDIALTGDTTKITFEEKVGLVPVEIRAKDGVPVFAQLTTAVLPKQGPPAPDRATLAAVLGLDSSDFRDDGWAPQSYSTGLPFLFVPVTSLDAVARARLRLEAWEAAFRGAWAKDIFIFAMGGERAGSDVHARMFGPGVSVPEDPATGSACASLAGYLAARDNRRDGTLRWIVEQGFEMGRPSILEVEADVSAGTPTAVRVGGSTVLVCEGAMSIS
ncbi:MAG: phenazine biosynthesis protein PhzF family [Gemmatimonadetes bacterium]|nr:phenazine biosynthesis protein PhzF family [Gemmatimonadota bacterium]